MQHIRQKNSSTDSDKSYIIVKTDDWSLPLDQHPSIIEHPEFFEIANCDIPQNFTHLIYVSDANN